MFSQHWVCSFCFPIRVLSLIGNECIGCSGAVWMRPFFSVGAIQFVCINFCLFFICFSVSMNYTDHLKDDQ